MEEIYRLCSLSSVENYKRLIENPIKFEPYFPPKSDSSTRKQGRWKPEFLGGEASSSGSQSSSNNHGSVVKERFSKGPRK